MENIPVYCKSVSENSDKLRVILDLRHVNMHVYKDKIKFEDWEVILNYVENEFLSTSLISSRTTTTDILNLNIKNIWVLLGK